MVYRGYCWKAEMYIIIPCMISNVQFSGCEPPLFFSPWRLLSAADIHLLKSNTPKDKIKKAEYKYWGNRSQDSPWTKKNRKTEKRLTTWCWGVVCKYHHWHMVHAIDISFIIPFSLTNQNESSLGLKYNQCCRKQTLKWNISKIICESVCMTLFW